MEARVRSSFRRGTAAHIAVMHDQLVEKKKWIGNEAFLHGAATVTML